MLDLESANFRIFENGNQQAIRYFGQDDTPVSVGLLVDSSGSMRGKGKKAAEAAAAFFQMANSDDEFFLIKFDESPRLITPFTSDTEELYREISHTRPFGRTSLYDAVNLALDVMKRARHQRRALVILSDGGDNRSRRSFSTIKSRAAETGIPIYSMGIFNPLEQRSQDEDEKDGPMVLDQLASLTGGRHFPVQIADLPANQLAVGTITSQPIFAGI
ncbi:MAG: VWA domain-containing protein [Acidobacteriota bacterium]